jgi:hypothetical protein
MNFIKNKTFARLDIYQKLKSEDHRIKTKSGAIVSIISGVIMLWLFLSEFSLYLSKDIKPELVVDSTRDEKLRINFDILFHKMACAFLSIDAMDISDQHNLDVVHNIFKTRIGLDGKPVDQSGSEKQDLSRDEATPNLENKKDENYCGSCYGAAPDGKCCNTCEEVREAYRIKGWAFSQLGRIEQCVNEGFEEKLKSQVNEGCRIYGYLLVNKVAGNFHFAPGKSFQQNNQHVHDLEIFKMASSFNLSHTINRLSFGTDFPGIINPLDEAVKIWTKDGSSEYQYYVKVVPTVYEDLKNNILNTNQYSVTEYERTVVTENNQGVPGVFFNYDISPIRVIFKETTKSFAIFITSVCAIIGGVFTVASIIDSMVYHSIRTWAKESMGKYQ